MSRQGAGDARRPAAPVDAGSEAAGVSAALLDAAVAATTTLLAFNQPADAALSGFFRAHRSGGRDRAFIAETAYAVLRTGAAVAVAGARHVAAPARRALPKARPSGWPRSGASRNPS
jgi:hypothetical protein